MLPIFIPVVLACAPEDQPTRPFTLDEVLNLIGCDDVTILDDRLISPFYEPAWYYPAPPTRIIDAIFAHCKEELPF